MSASPKLVTACLLCDKPLGQESRDMGFWFCHEHRACSTCGTGLGPKELQSCWKEAIETADGAGVGKPPRDYFNIQHARCSVTERKNGEQDPSVLIKQSYLDFLNNARLLIESNVELSPDSNGHEAGRIAEKLLHTMSFDERYLFLARMEGAVAHVRIALKADKQEMKKRADEREAEKFKRAKDEAKQSARPAGTPLNDEKELEIIKFMTHNGIKDRTVALKLMRERQKAIDGFITIGMKLEVATIAVDEMLRKQGRIK